MVRYLRFNSTTRLFVCTLLAVSLFHVTSAKGSESKYPDLTVENPFATDLALQNLRKILPDLPAEIEPQLRHIRKITYHFEEPPAENCEFPALCDPRRIDKPTFKIIRSINLDISYLDDAFKRAMVGLQKDACSDLKFNNMRRLSVSDVQIIFAADLIAHKRACGDWPGGLGSWKTDLATSTGDLTESISLLLTPPDLQGLTSSGTITVSLSKPEAHISNTNLLGFIDSDSVVGQILTEILQIGKFSLDTASFHTGDLGLSDILNTIHKKNYDIAIPYDIQQVIHVAGDFSVYMENYERVFKDVADYYLDTNLTRFHSSQSIDISLDISHFALKGDFDADNYYAAKQEEIKLISGFSKPPTQYRIREGDNLEKVSVAVYGTKIFKYVLAIENEAILRQESFPIDRIMVAPQLWEIFHKYGDRMLLPEQSYKAYWKSSCKKTSWEEFRKVIPGGYSIWKSIWKPERFQPVHVAPECE